MLKIYDPSDVTNVIPFPIEDDKRYVTHKYDGYDTLTFEIDSSNQLYKYIAEEVKIEDEKNRYVVKKIDEHSDFVTVVCNVDLDDWKSEVFQEFRTTNAMLAEVLSTIVPDGWQIIGAGQFTKRTTIEETEGEPLKCVTAADILLPAAEAYSCVFNFNSVKKTIEAIDPTSFKASGDFFTDELNLKNLGYVGDSTEFATRLYAFGKKDEEGNPLTFESINGGKPYVEDYTYSDKIISVGWTDERYTDKQSLLDAAIAKLKQLSFPSRSYTCDAQNITKGAWLYKVVTLIDRRRKTRVEHQIVEYKEYPESALDSITLSMTAPKIESYVGKVESNLNEKLYESNFIMQKLLQDAVNNATEMITGNKGGNFIWIFDDDGKPLELVNLGDTDDINTAKSVWRWNASGLGHSNTGYDGHYTLALLADGSINADAITTGVMTANLIRAGKLTDLKGLNYWDLETGEFSLTSGTKVNTGSEVKTLATLLDEAGGELTQESVFKALTNDGQSKGIYLKDGELYINATYLGTGAIFDSKGKKIIDLENGTIDLNGQVSANGNFEIGTDGKIKAVQAIFEEAKLTNVAKFFEGTSEWPEDDYYATMTHTGMTVWYDGELRGNFGVSAGLDDMYGRGFSILGALTTGDDTCNNLHIGSYNMYLLNQNIYIKQGRWSDDQDPVYKGRTGTFSFGTSISYRFVNGLLVEEV